MKGIIAKFAAAAALTISVIGAGLSEKAMATTPVESNINDVIVMVKDLDHPLCRPIEALPEKPLCNTDEAKEKNVDQDENKEVISLREEVAQLRQAVNRKPEPKLSNKIEVTSAYFEEDGSSSIGLGARYSRPSWYVGFTKNDAQRLQIDAGGVATLSPASRMNIDIKIEKKTQIEFKYTFEF